MKTIVEVTVCAGDRFDVEVTCEPRRGKPPRASASWPSSIWYARPTHAECGGGERLTLIKQSGTARTMGVIRVVVRRCRAPLVTVHVRPRVRVPVSAAQPMQFEPCDCITDDDG